MLREVRRILPRGFKIAFDAIENGLPVRVGSKNFARVEIAKDRSKAFDTSECLVNNPRPHAGILGMLKQAKIETGDIRRHLLAGIRAKVGVDDFLGDAGCSK